LAILKAKWRILSGIACNGEAAAGRFVCLFWAGGVFVFFGLSGRRFCAGSGLRVPTFSLVKSMVGSAPAFNNNRVSLRSGFVFTSP
jgi:hypothetical protein